MVFLKNKNIRTLVIFITQKCNLKCSYCYVNQNNIDINNEILKKSLYFFLRCDGNLKNVIFVGGEPFLKFDIIEKAISSLKFLKGKFPSKKIVTVINTNGTVISNRVLKILESVDHVAISLDGQKMTHNLHRKFHNGRGTFDKVINTVKIINKICPQKFVVNKIITSMTAHNLFQDVLFLLSLQPESISLNVALGDLGWNKNKVNILFQNAERLYLWIKNHWDNKLVRNKFQLLFKPILHECPMAHLSIDSIGNIYPCEILLSRKEDLAGNVILDYLRPDIIDCKFSIESERCTKELCRSCDQICRKVYFDSWPSRSAAPYADKWLEKALEFQAFFLKRYEEDEGKLRSFRREDDYMLRNSLKIF